MPDGEGVLTPLEEKLNTISSKITEIQDLQLVNKLDIINLKNEIEKINLTVSAPSLETVKNIREMGKIAEHIGNFKDIKNLLKNIDKIMAQVDEMKPEGLEEMIRVVDDIDKRVRKMEAGELGIKPEEAAEYASMIEGLRAGFNKLPKGAKDALALAKQVERVRLMEEDNARKLLELSRDVRSDRITKVKEPERPAKVKKHVARRPVKLKIIERRAAEKPKESKCPECGIKLPSHAKFCGKCGRKM